MQNRRRERLIYPISTGGEDSALLDDNDLVHIGQIVELMANKDSCFSFHEITHDASLEKSFTNMSIHSGEGVIEQVDIRVSVNSSCHVNALLLAA